MKPVTRDNRIKRLVKQLLELNACDPRCQGRCRVCPNEVAKEAADALIELSKELVV